MNIGRVRCLLLVLSLTLWACGGSSDSERSFNIESDFLSYTKHRFSLHLPDDWNIYIAVAMPFDLQWNLGIANILIAYVFSCAIIYLCERVFIDI